MRTTNVVYVLPMIALILSTAGCENQQALLDQLQAEKAEIQNQLTEAAEKAKTLLAENESLQGGLEAAKAAGEQMKEAASQAKVAAEEALAKAKADAAEALAQVETAMAAADAESKKALAAANEKLSEVSKQLEAANSKIAELEAALKEAQKPEESEEESPSEEE